MQKKNQSFPKTPWSCLFERQSKRKAPCRPYHLSKSYIL